MFDVIMFVLIVLLGVVTYGVLSWCSTEVDH